MKVILAGYNLDSSTIDGLSGLAREVSEGCGSSRDLSVLCEQANELADEPITPETVATAYARISRDPDPVDRLRKKARSDIAATRRSAQTIVFGMNHQSVAEHAVFNFDIIDISRLAVESLQWHRLCSYTEKSQRYQKLQGDFVTPGGFTGEDRELFEKTIALQNQLYHKSFPVLHEYQKEKNPEMMETRFGPRTVEGWAKEDARYCVSLATHSQMGFTTNARNLEYIIRCARASPLAEVRELGDRFFSEASKVAPSLILLTDPDEYKKQFNRPLVDDHFTKTDPNIRSKVSEVFSRHEDSTGEDLPGEGDCRLVSWDKDMDLKVTASVLAARSGEDAGRCLAVARKIMDGPDDQCIIRELLRHSNPWESATRELETGTFLFEVVLSAGCFGQMKRHRMSTQLVQPYDPTLGYTIPPSVEDTGLAEDFNKVYDASTEAYERLRENHPQDAQYVLTNGHRRRMLLAASPRELYHMSRLREDPHAQWDIQNITRSILKLARDAAPRSMILAWGKDAFVEKKKEMFPES